jgi:PadR family transcriptional regulator PadR
MKPGLSTRNTEDCGTLPFYADRSPGLTPPVEVMQGTLTVLILKALSLESIHGWGITDRVETLSRGAFRIGQGTLYPALHRFEARGWVTSHWRTTDNNRLAKYYQLTATGKQVLAEEIAGWRFYTESMGLVIDPR